MCVNADRTGPLAPPPFSQMSVMWKITMLLRICNQKVKWKSAFLFFIFFGGVSVC